MTIPGRHLLIVILAAFTVVSITISGNADTLFKSRQPVKIGHGKKDGGKIVWTDCDGQNKETFAEPPYSVDYAENCKVSPFSFGLECQGEACTVVDSAKTQKYLPGVQNGQKVQLRVNEHTVEIQAEGQKMHIER